MKLCVIGTRGFPYVEGGVEKHCESVYPFLAKDSEIIVFRRKPYVKSHTAQRNIRFIDLPSTRIKGFEALFHSFISTLYAICLHPDVVHIHNIGPALFAPLLKLFSIPVVLTYHSANYEHKKWGPLARSILRFCERVALRYSDRIVFVNRFQMQKYPQQIQNKSVYIPNGIPAPIVSSKQDFLDTLGIQPYKYILSVGRITPEKGFETLIHAFKNQLPSEYKLVIVGGVESETAYMHKLKLLSEDTPVVFTGYVFGESLAQLYSHAALFVLASENEGFPLVLLEAMSYNLDVLVSDIPATHLVALDSTDYFPVNDVQNLSARLQEKLSAPLSRNYDLSPYNWSQIADRLSLVFCEASKE